MGPMTTQANAPGASSATSPASPLPQIEIKPTAAGGKKGPGTAPRTNYSRVNTVVPPAPDAGAEAQKSLAPRGVETLPHKAASISNEESMATMTERPRLQDMVKAAMAHSIARVDINAEAARQAANMGEEKIAESEDVRPAPAAVTEKRASAEYALKLASAVEYIVDTLGKEGSVIVSAPGVSQSNKTETFPAHQGQGHHQPPMHPGVQKGLKTEQSPTQLENTLDHPAGGSEKMMQTNYGKKTAASDKDEKKPDEKKPEKGENPFAKAKDDKEPEEKKGSANVLALIRKTAGAPKSAAVAQIRQTVKQAEDRINPAKISAGRAIPPEASASGEPGGHPVGGPPQGPTSLIGSNESAINYKRNAAYSNRKQDLKKYFNEPPLSSETDKTLQQAFEHTGQAGTKFGSAELSTKTAAAKALIAKLAEETAVVAETDKRSA